MYIMKQYLFTKEIVHCNRHVKGFLIKLEIALGELDFFGHRAQRNQKRFFKGSQKVDF